LFQFGEPKGSFEKNGVPLARVTLPAEAIQIGHPGCFAPRDGFVPNVNGSFNLAKK